MLDQRGVISEFGVRGAPDVPFTPYKTFQTKISEVERLTGLTFKAGKGAKRVSLGEFDRLATAKAAAPMYIELRTFDDVVRL